MSQRRCPGNRASGVRAGAVAVSFILVFPLFLMVVSIIVQYALMLNARLSLEHAAEAAARSAVTSLPEDKPDNVRQAARMALAAMSPRSKLPVTAAGTQIANALAQTGATVPDHFAERYAYAEDASDIDWTGGANSRNEARTTTVTIKYRFKLTVPFAALAMSPNVTTVGGASGRYMTLTASSTVESSHGRKSNSDGSGWPR